jgi:hypothetical protein
VYSFGGTALFEPRLCPIRCSTWDSLSAHSVRYGAVGGYDFKVLQRLTLRPQIGLGRLTASYRSETDGFSNSDAYDHFYLEPGMGGTVAVAHLLVGADANALLVSGGSRVAFTAHGLVGIAF